MSKPIDDNMNCFVGKKMELSSELCVSGAVASEEERILATTQPVRMEQCRSKVLFNMASMGQVFHKSVHRATKMEESVTGAKNLPACQSRDPSINVTLPDISVDTSFCVSSDEEEEEESEYIEFGTKKLSNETCSPESSNFYDINGNKFNENANENSEANLINNEPKSIPPVQSSDQKSDCDQSTSPTDKPSEYGNVFQPIFNKITDTLTNKVQSSSNLNGLRRQHKSAASFNVGLDEEYLPEENVFSIFQRNSSSIASNLKDFNIRPHLQAGTSKLTTDKSVLAMCAATRDLKRIVTEPNVKGPLEASLMKKDEDAAQETTTRFEDKRFVRHTSPRLVHRASAVHAKSCDFPRIKHQSSENSLFQRYSERRFTESEVKVHKATNHYREQTTDQNNTFSTHYSSKTKSKYESYLSTHLNQTSAQEHTNQLRSLNNFSVLNKMLTRGKKTRNLSEEREGTRRVRYWMRDLSTTNFKYSILSEHSPSTKLIMKHLRFLKAQQRSPEGTLAMLPFEVYRNTVTTRLRQRKQPEDSLVELFHRLGLLATSPKDGIGVSQDREGMEAKDRQTTLLIISALDSLPKNIPNKSTLKECLSTQGISFTEQDLNNKEEQQILWGNYILKRLKMLREFVKYLHNAYALAKVSISQVDGGSELYTILLLPDLNAFTNTSHELRSDYTTNVIHHLDTRLKGQCFVGQLTDDKNVTITNALEECIEEFLRNPKHK